MLLIPTLGGRVGQISFEFKAWSIQQAPGESGLQKKPVLGDGGEKIITSGYWRDDSVVKHTGCSSMDPESNSQQPPRQLTILYNCNAVGSDAPLWCADKSPI